MEKSSRNERRKVAAQYLNGVAVAALVAGAVSPALAQVNDGYAIAVSAMISLALHIAARQAVKGIED